MGGCGDGSMLVLCLLLLLWAHAYALENPRPLLPDNMLENSNCKICEGFHEGDIILTQEQKHVLHERKATDPARHWPRDCTGAVSVAYKFGDDIIDEDAVKEAIAHWEEHTCIRFNEVEGNVTYAHINFIDATFCASSVGRMENFPAGQTIWLASGCTSWHGAVIHEIGHALGFFHEHSRSDRDDYVVIVYKNIVSGSDGNFRKANTYNFGIEYDYASVMHYAPEFFSSNGMDTISALNPLAQPLMGTISYGLSFGDKLLANTMYKCFDQWLNECSISSDPCLNLGYTGPNCTCVCPAGTSGAQCEVFENSYTDGLIKERTPYSEKITTQGTVSTPGYPTPITTPTRFIKVLEAPSCCRVKLTFTDFEFAGRNNAGNCPENSLTIRTKEEFGSETRYCAQEIAPGTVFTSEKQTIVLDYKNSGTQNRGFNATIEHIPL